VSVVGGDCGLFVCLFVYGLGETRGRRRGVGCVCGRCSIKGKESIRARVCEGNREKIGKVGGKRDDDGRIGGEERGGEGKCGYK
jgi:hypothetical protein